jgi:hypothetical protein
MKDPHCLTGEAYLASSPKKALSMSTNTWFDGHMLKGDRTPLSALA